MILMKLLSPTSMPVLESDWKFYHKLYRAILSLMLFSYKRKVIFDHVVLGEGGAELLHCVRDEWFERQLKRFHVEYIPPVKVVSISATHSMRYGMFSWKDTMTLLRPQRLVPRETEPITIKPKEMIKPSIKPTIKPEAEPTPKPEVKQEAKPKPKPYQEEKRNRIRFKDDEIKVKPTPKPKEQEAPIVEYTHHLGFDENDIF